ncbi:hypothetical protein Ciccas_006818 [Cichlidogyrus casuarinus]|uniref:Uncharacterized protein n=1 Tax=Cichlidogyrus casuarinus TaxID=1844966 RepID=A0ABD2Q8I7_9PLAT
MAWYLALGGAYYFLNNLFAKQMQNDTPTREPPKIEPTSSDDDFVEPSYPASEIEMQETESENLDWRSEISCTTHGDETEIPYKSQHHPRRLFTPRDTRPTSLLKLGPCTISRLHKSNLSNELFPNCVHKHSPNKEKQIVF